MSEVSEVFKIVIKRMKNGKFKSTTETKRISAWNATAYNGFGVMAAVAPQKRQCGNERLYPSGSSIRKSKFRT